MAQPLIIHGRSSFVAEVSFADNAGNPVDLSAKTVFFETKNVGFRKALIASITNPHNKTLVLTTADVDELDYGDTSFIIRDETTPNMETLMGEGVIRRLGWTSQ